MELDSHTISRRLLRKSIGSPMISPPTLLVIFWTKASATRTASCPSKISSLPRLCPFSLCMLFAQSKLRDSAFVFASAFVVVVAPANGSSMTNERKRRSKHFMMNCWIVWDGLVAGRNIFLKSSFDTSFCGLSLVVVLLRIDRLLVMSLLEQDFSE